MEYVRRQNKIVLRLEKGEEITESLKALREKEGIAAASFTGIGATDDATIGVYLVSEKRYEAVRLTGDMEIAALTGNLTADNKSRPYVHAHIVLGRGNEAHAGHLNTARVSATAEIFLDVVDIPIGRRFDDETGLNIFSFYYEFRSGSTRKQNERRRNDLRQDDRAIGVCENLL